MKSRLCQFYENSRQEKSQTQILHAQNSISILEANSSVFSSKRCQAERPRVQLFKHSPKGPNQTMRIENLNLIQLSFLPPQSLTYLLTLQQEGPHRSIVKVVKNALHSQMQGLCGGSSAPLSISYPASKATHYVKPPKLKCQLLASVLTYNEMSQL